MKPGAWPGSMRPSGFSRISTARIDGLIRGALLPDRIQTCTPALLQRTAALSRELNAPMRLHCCQGLGEVAMVEQLRGVSPLGWLEQLGLLTPRSLLPHGIYTRGDDDLQRVVDGGASLVHCPVVFARDGEALNSFGRYRAKGINFALGTDTWPADLLENMRQGLNIARLMEGGALADQHAGPVQRRHARRRQGPGP